MTRRRSLPELWFLHYYNINPIRTSGKEVSPIWLTFEDGISQTHEGIQGSTTTIPEYIYDLVGWSDSRYSEPRTDMNPSGYVLWYLIKPSYFTNESKGTHRNKGLGFILVYEYDIVFLTMNLTPNHNGSLSFFFLCKYRSIRTIVEMKQYFSNF